MTAAGGLWSLTRGEARSDQLWGVDADVAGDVYVAGYGQSPASAPFYDVVLYKLTSAGQQLWRAQWGGPFQEKSFVVAVSPPYVLVGGEQSDSLDVNRSKLVVLAFDTSTGHLAWTWSWDSGAGYDEVDGLVVDGDSIYVSGWVGSASASGDVVVARLDRSTRATTWLRTWGGPGFDEADGQLVVDDHAVYVSGRYGGSGPLTGGQALLARFDKATGAETGHVTWGNGLYEDGLGMTSDGTSLYVTGLSIEGFNGQIFLRAFDKDLETAWSQDWGGSGGESARAVAIGPSGTIVVAGSTFSSGAGKDDVVLLGYSPAGRLLWQHVWGGPGHDAAYGLAIAGSTGYIAGATENGAVGQEDGLLVRVDAGAGTFPPAPH